MLKIVEGHYPIVFHWTVLILLPILATTTQANFNLEKSILATCDRHCFNGACINGTCVCTKGWTGQQCDHCFGRIKVNSKQNQIADGPLSYSPSSKCTWIIENDQNYTGPLNIRLDSFQSECGWDYLYIYDGDGVDGEQLAAFSGDQEVQEISAPSGQALIYFSSDLAINLDGFNLTYEFNRCLYNCSSHGTCDNGKCDCDDGHIGDYCQIMVCTKADESNAGPCMNKGVCKNEKCECPSTHHGKYCEEERMSSVWEEIHSRGPTAGRSSHSSVLIDDVIWTVGGAIFNGVMIDQLIVFNITSEVWTTIVIEGTEHPESRYDHTLVRYKNKLYMFGGVVDNKNIVGELWSFDMHTRMWHLEMEHNSNLTTPPLAVSGHTAHVIGSEMYVFFGYHPQLGFCHEIQIYDFETGKWRLGQVNDQVYGRFGHASVHHITDQGDIVLIHGGSMWSSAQNNNFTDSMLQYHIQQKKWTILPPSGIKVFLHSASLMNGFMILVGGNGYNIGYSKTKQECFTNSIQIYDIACKQWTNITSVSDVSKRYGHTAVANNDYLYIYGGFNGRMLNDIWKMTIPQCSAATRPETCHVISGGVKCIFTERSCVRLDPNVSHKQPFLSLLKDENSKGSLACGLLSLRQSCEEQTDCLACVSQSACGWCASGDQCLPTDSECVDGQAILKSWEKCPERKNISPRPCSMSNECHSCKLLPHCNWHSSEGKSSCISLEEEAILIAERQNKELERISANGLPRNHPHLPPEAIHDYSQCPAACSNLTTCTQCTSSSRCMWCPNMAKCINMEAYTLTFAYGQCYSWLSGSTLRGSRICSQDMFNCSSHKTCADCQLSPDCGWLDDGSHTGLGACLQGNARGPLNETLNDVDRQWYFVDCPSCQCNGHANCESTITTALGGTQEVCGICANNTQGKHCDSCASGFFGDPRNGGICQPCQCNGQADDCDQRSGHCYCRTKGVVGKHCDKCDAKYYGQPRNGTPCYYELAVDFIFTFKLKKEDKDLHATELFLFSIPYKRDTDVTFQITCDQHALVALNETSSYLTGAKTRRLMTNTPCDYRGFRRIYSASDAEGWIFGTDSNTTFFVKVYNFTTPIVVQVSFAQSPPINWVLFFVIFAACFIVLLVVAGLLWMIKMRIEIYRRNQRRIDEIEHMASRPFPHIWLELSSYHLMPTDAAHGPTPLAIEPYSNYKAGIFTLAVRLPTGGRSSTPSGTSGLAVASSLCQLTTSQLSLLQKPGNCDHSDNRKTALRRFLPFLRRDS